MASQPVDPGVRVAALHEFGLLRTIEAASDALFADVGIGPFVLDVEDDDHLEHSSVVLVSGEPPVGFVSVGIVDGAAHIWQLSVDPVFGRQGRGTALLEAACDWARDAGLGSITLTTYRDVPWNGPFYARRGFVVVDDLLPGLAAVRAHERANGDDDFGPRVAMRRQLGR